MSGKDQDLVSDQKVAGGVLNKNQKKKLRKYKGRLGKQGPAGTSTSTCSTAGSQARGGGGSSLLSSSLTRGAEQLAGSSPAAADQAARPGEEGEAASARHAWRGPLDRPSAGGSGPDQRAGPCPRVDLSAAALCLAQRLGGPLSGDPPGQAGPSAVSPREGRGPPPAVWGNYRRYYGKRLVEGLAEDPRLLVMEESWFRGKHCLDIGCNTGLLTLQLARKFGPASLVGVDLDEQLVREACRRLQQLRHSLTADLATGAGAGPKAALRRAVAALAATSFQHGDFLAQAPPQPASLDAVLCLSVTKWLHLARGDAGVEALFARCSAALRPGGLLLLEPQPWKSYVNAHKRPGAARAGYAALASLRLRPEHFLERLTARHGFRLVRELGQGHPLPGFDRPLYLLERVGGRQGH